MGAWWSSNCLISIRVMYSGFWDGCYRISWKYILRDIMSWRCGRWCMKMSWRCDKRWFNGIIYRYVMMCCVLLWVNSMFLFWTTSASAVASRSTSFEAAVKNGDLCVFGPLCSFIKVIISDFTVKGKLLISVFLTIWAIKSRHALSWYRKL